MAEKKAATKTKQKGWVDEDVSFKYGARTYRQKIKGRLVLNELSVEEIKKNLNEIPGKFAYWKSLQVHVELELEALKEEFDIWNAGKYNAASEKFDKKPTETAITNRIILDNVDQFRKRRTAMRELENVVKLIGVITKSFDYQVWTLGRVAGLTAQEMNNLEPRVVGKGNIRNMD